MSDKQIQDWQEKVRANFGNQSKLYEYLFSTMDNFYYRYLETTTDQHLKTIELNPNCWGARSSEGSMVDALKITNPQAKKGIIEMAKAVPKALGPHVDYELSARVVELRADKGEIHFLSVINWGHPDYQDPARKILKSVVFKYDDLTKFRKELALRLEDVCSIFL
jgi:hypothetical protein